MGRSRCSRTAARSIRRPRRTCTTGICFPSASCCWLKELETYKKFPPLQAPETYNLDGILKAMQDTHQSN